MANVKVKVNTSKLRRNLSKVNPAVNKSVATFLPELIQKVILKGLSPVKGQGRFKRYSDSYRSAIKKGYVDNKSKISPVNLSQTGQMRKSIYSKANNKSVTVAFRDEKAEYHNKGTDRLPRRAMLPTESGEEFNSSITLRLREVATKVINKVLGWITKE